MEQIDFEVVLAGASKLPIVNVDRELFLRKELREHYSSEVVDLAIKYNPAYAGIPVEEINKIAKSCISVETAQVTIGSAVAGIPGGIAMIGTVPADLTQYFGHILHILQELMYLYGWQKLQMNDNELTEETKNILTLFVGVMFGVDGAVGAVNKIASQAAQQVVKKLPQQALTKGVIYPIVKKVCQLIGVQMTKEIFAKWVGKLIPLVGGAISGGLTYASFKPMANKLMNYLSGCELADVRYYEKSRDHRFINAGDTDRGYIQG